MLAMLGGVFRKRRAGVCEQQSPRLTATFAQSQCNVGPQTWTMRPMPQNRQRQGAENFTQGEDFSYG